MKSNIIEIKRSELKYYISNLDAKLLSLRLGVLLSPDPYNTSDGGYPIRSLYFDSYDNECLYQKQSGNFMRKKYRLRIYDSESNEVKFEVKHKNNQQVFKETAILSRESAQQMVQGNYKSMLDYNNPVLEKSYVAFVTRKYSPRVLIDYTREAFIYSHFNIRITIDRNLKSSSTQLDLFNANQHLTPVVLEGKQILEIKYDKYLPDFIRLGIGLSRHERSAISKYTLGRRFSKTSKWEDN